MYTQDQLLQKNNLNNEIVEKALLDLYGNRYREYRQNYILAGEFAYEPEFPLYLMLEQTYSCNLKCPSCIHGFPDEKKVFDTGLSVMPRSVFEKIILEGKENNCPSVAFHVNDEPLLVKDLPERVAFAKNNGFMDIFLTTNGTLLTLPRAIKLIDAGVTQVLFSIDAATPETYEKTRPGGRFKQVWDNICALVQYKKENNLVLPALRASFVNSRLNAHERQFFIEKFSPLVDYVEIQGFSSYYLTNTHLIPQGAHPIEEFSCNEPWRKLIIRSNGDVLPCCSFYGYEIIVGNIDRQSLKEIFQGDQCAELRKEFKEGKFSLSPCQACSKSFYMAPE